jgi:hypothetical protein
MDLLIIILPVVGGLLLLVAVVIVLVILLKRRRESQRRKQRRLELNNIYLENKMSMRPDSEIHPVPVPEPPPTLDRHTQRLGMDSFTSLNSIELNEL